MRHLKTHHMLYTAFTDQCEIQSYSILNLCFCVNTQFTLINMISTE
jgi:hypothetical protein